MFSLVSDCFGRNAFLFQFICTHIVYFSCTYDKMAQAYWINKFSNKNAWKMLWQTNLNNNQTLIPVVTFTVLSLVVIIGKSHKVHNSRHPKVLCKAILYIYINQTLVHKKGQIHHEGSIDAIHSCMPQIRMQFKWRHRE